MKFAWIEVTQLYIREKTWKKTWKNLCVLSYFETGRYLRFIYLFYFFVLKAQK